MKTSDREHIQLDIDGSEFIMLHFALHNRARYLSILGREDDAQRCLKLRDKLSHQAGVPFGEIEGGDAL